jgi:SAM-dependent methyltransferase
MRPELSPVERFLDAFHEAVPAATPAAFAAMHTDGASGYERLLGHLAALPHGATVLDLACGDGEWLARAGRLRPDLRLVGVDLCEAELQRARSRLAPAADLRCERAQAMSLAAASVDALVCHMALMLMGDIDVVVAEIRRVLRPGGVFGAVLGLRLDATPAGIAWRDAMDAALAADVDRPQLRFGDPRMRAAAGLEGLFSEGFHGHHFEPFSATVEGSPETLWASLQLSYDPFLLTPAGRGRLRDAAFAAWQSLGAAPPLQLRWRLGHFSCRRDG